MKVQSKKVMKKRASTEKSNRKKVFFEMSAETGSEVYIAGSFNDWNPRKKKLKDSGTGTYVANLLLERGQHEYKFVVNGEWRSDAHCEEWSPNGVGSLNSIISVG